MNDEMFGGNLTWNNECSIMIPTAKISSHLLALQF